MEEPQREGFGSKLLRRSIEGELGGRVALRFPPTGVVGELFIPLGYREQERDLRIQFGRARRRCIDRLDARYGSA